MYKFRIHLEVQYKRIVTGKLIKLIKKEFTLPVIYIEISRLLKFIKLSMLFIFVTQNTYIINSEFCLF